MDWLVTLAVVLAIVLAFNVISLVLINSIGQTLERWYEKRDRGGANSRGP